MLLEYFPCLKCTYQSELFLYFECYLSIIYYYYYSSISLTLVKQIWFLVLIIKLNIKYSLLVRNPIVAIVLAACLANDHNTAIIGRFSRAMIRQNANLIGKRSPLQWYKASKSAPPYSVSTNKLHLYHTVLVNHCLFRWDSHRSQETLQLAGWRLEMFTPGHQCPLPRWQGFFWHHWPEQWLWIMCPQDFF